VALDDARPNNSGGWFLNLRSLDHSQGINDDIVVIIKPIT